MQCSQYSCECGKEWWAGYFDRGHQLCTCRSLVAPREVAISPSAVYDVTVIRNSGGRHTERGWLEQDIRWAFEGNVRKVERIVEVGRE